MLNLLKLWFLKKPVTYAKIGTTTGESEICTGTYFEGICELW
ncbi:hypothetical protein ZORO111902_18715 [Zobellia roscoffensis]